MGSSERRFLRCGSGPDRAWLHLERRFGGAHLIHVDSGLLALTETGELVRFEASEKAYSEKARATVMKGLTRAAPALADGQLYLRNENQLRAVKLK